MVIRTLVNHCKGKIGYAVIFFIYSKVKRAVLLKFDEMLVSKKKIILILAIISEFVIHLALIMNSKYRLHRSLRTNNGSEFCTRLVSVTLKTFIIGLSTPQSGTKINSEDTMTNNTHFLLLIGLL